MCPMRPSNVLLGLKVPVGSKKTSDDHIKMPSGNQDPPQARNGAGLADSSADKVTKGIPKRRRKRRSDQPTTTVLAHSKHSRRPCNTLTNPDITKNASTEFQKLRLEETARIIFRFTFRRNNHHVS